MQKSNNKYIIVSLLLGLMFFFTPLSTNATHECPADFWQTFNGDDNSIPSECLEHNTSTRSSFQCSLTKAPKIQHIFDYIGCILNISVIPLMFSVALVLFLYGVVQYVMNDTDGGKREKGKQYMVWGIIGLTVMVSIWGLVNLLGRTFNLDTSVTPKISPR